MQLYSSKVNRYCS